MRRTLAVLGFSAVLASTAASLMLLASETRAVAADATFLVPANDGYGIAECLTSSLACGQVVADAWCEAQGYARASSFGRTAPGDVTGSVVPVSSIRRDEPIAITCAN